MAAVAERAPTNSKHGVDERIVEFSMDRVRAPFLLRCAALLIDYLLMLLLPTSWLIISGWLDETGVRSIGIGVWIIGLIVFATNFLLFPLIRGRTIGKGLLGLTILRSDGSSLNFRSLILRNIVGYALTLLTGGLGFLLSAVNASGRALHDFVGGTVVVRARKTLREKR
jgi:uncharacterized RDD family membrane protein YckC